MSPPSNVNPRVYRFSTERLAADAGLRTPPRLSYGLPIVLPEDTRVRSHRVVVFAGRQYIEWSPNHDSVSYNPGIRSLSDPLTWPLPSSQRTLRHVDGALGRFDYSRFPQFGERDIWSAAMLTASEDDAAPIVELLPVFQTWSCEASADHGQFSPAVLNELRTRRALFEQRTAAATQQLETAQYSRIVQKLRTTRPRYANTPSIDDLERCSTFEDAVDLGMTYSRVSLALEAYAAMGSEAAADTHACDTMIASCPVARKNENRQGRWLHGLTQEIAAYLLRNQYPAYLVHPSAFVDFVEGVDVNWLGMNARQADWSAEWMSFTERLSIATTAPDTISNTFTPIIEHTWLMDNADPASYGWALPGEELTPRRTPSNAPMPEDLPGGRRNRAAAVNATAPHMEASDVAGPSQLPAEMPPPGYSTVPQGQAADMSEDEEGVRYEQPPSDVQPVGQTFVTIDPHRVDHIQPPAVQALAKKGPFQTNGLMRYVLMEVNIRGQTRLVARHVGSKRSAAKTGYPFEDRENRRAIVFPHPPHLNWPGVVDGERFGFPAPNVLYYGLAGNSGRAHVRSPSRWMYPMEGSGVRRVHVREGTTPPRPGPEQLPPRSAVSRNIFAMSPLDARASDYWNEQYANPEEFNGPSVIDEDTDAEDEEPLPLYPGGSATQAGDHAMDTSDDFPSGAPSVGPAAPTSAPTPLSPPRSTTNTDPLPSPSRARAGPAPSPSGSRDKGKGREDAMDTTPDGAQTGRSSMVPADSPYIVRGRYSADFVQRNGRALKGGSALMGYSPRGDAPALGSPLLPHTMVVRGLHRWVSAADLEYAIRALMDAVGERGLGLLRALSAGTGEPDRTGQRPTFDVYFTFDTVRDAFLAMEYAGYPWVFPTTGGRRNIKSNSRFYAFHLYLVGEEDVAVASSSDDVLRYPWFTLYRESTDFAREWDRQALTAQPSYRPPTPRYRAPRPQPPTSAARGATPPPPSSYPSTEPGTSSSSSSSVSASSTLSQLETRIDFVSRTVTISLSELPRLSQMGVDVSGVEVRLDMSEGTATLPLDTMVRILMPRAPWLASSPRKSLADRLTDPSEPGRDGEAATERRKRRRRRGYTPPSTLPGPSRRRSPSPPPPLAALSVPSSRLWTWKQATTFVDLCRRLSVQTLGGPHDLPPNAISFLAAVLDEDEETVRQCWAAICDILPELDTADLDEQDMLFRVHGPDFMVAAETLNPPYITCQSDECHGKRLIAKHGPVRVRIFTLRRGVLPAFEQACDTLYHHNYSVHRPGDPRSQRLYYGGIPKWISAQKTVVFERDLILHFEAQMVHQRASADGIAETYNAALGGCQAINRTTLEETLQGPHVYYAFFLHALLRDKNRQGEILSLPHAGNQADRLTQALYDRNVRFQGTGYVRVVVCDGVVMGHPCCSYGDVCRNPLENPRKRFCVEHRHKETLCFMARCSLPRRPSHLSCELTEHKAEEEKVVRDTKHSLENLRRRGLHSAASRVMGGEVIDSTPEELPEVRRDRRRREEFITRRRWTKYEFVTIFPCGVIASRATMFRAEAETGVEVPFPPFHTMILLTLSFQQILRGTFPPKYPGGKPSYIFYDRNCKLRRFLENKGDTYFLGDVGLVVDVFHLQHAHSRSDNYCGLHCNPANYPELISDEGDAWRFNSEVCEINFMWYGSYAAIVRDMSSYRYNFYLDEMVMLHNEKVVEKLTREGQRPHIIPEDALRHIAVPASD
ncbi:uncharacterized protein SCHCODRAFT_02597868 [Schizophyllum commune H4-8]|uniref:Uncharacterized protein n=1 Tax=Schizophyllum commune (strain H4-8 / FGSC 9210) TaxID=578458 RepID=D8PXV9_SCHCM|nr:uncharacterized protein SCHCODRAFT_02597868 [Schizophyllum commune H4-8]KAI5897072.1 hypothetical protein SCHCODRAFT_02597868 [Schizophyllum commune H4-8]